MFCCRLFPRIDSRGIYESLRRTSWRRTIVGRHTHTSDTAPVLIEIQEAFGRLGNSPALRNQLFIAYKVELERLGSIIGFWHIAHELVCR